jgi:hypothetical protein
MHICRDVGSKLKDSITSLVPGKKQQTDSSRLQQRSPYSRAGECCNSM